METVTNVVLETRTTDHWVGLLEAAGVPCGPVYQLRAYVRRPAGASPPPRFNMRATPNWARPLDQGRRAEVAQYWEANAETWTRHARAGYDIYRDRLKTPAFLDMLPRVHGLCDIGCGEGSNTRELGGSG